MSKPSWFERSFERAISLVSPKRAARRAHFRRMERDPDYAQTVFAMMGARGYRAADPNQSSTPWYGSARDANAELGRKLPTLRDRSRELNTDDSIGSGLTKTFINNVIGTGLRPQAKTGDPDKNRDCEAVWAERCDHTAPSDELTHPEAQRMRYGKVLEDGGVLVKQAIAKPGEPVWFETVEMDRVDTPIGAKPADSKGEISQGIEKDRWGRVVAFWVRKARAGGVYATAIHKDSFERVDRSVAQHLKRSTLARPGQSHGVPLTHAVMQDIRDLDLLIHASLKRVQIAASLAIFIKSEQGIDDLFETTAEKHGYRLKQDIEPGMIFKLFPGESIESLVPNFPTPEFTPFVVMLARRIGAALGVSWQIVLKDFSDANYSSARTDLIEARAVFRVEYLWFAKKSLEWEWRAVLLDAKLRGDARMRNVSFEEIGKVDWIHQGWQWVDPEKEAKATKIMLQIGLTCLRDEAAAQGKDWEELQEQRVREAAREQELRDKFNLDDSIPLGPRPAEKKKAEAA